MSWNGRANFARAFLLPHFGQNVFEVYSTGTAHKWVVGHLFTACKRTSFTGYCVKDKQKDTETESVRKQAIVCNMVRKRNRNRNRMVRETAAQDIVCHMVKDAL